VVGRVKLPQKVGGVKNGKQLILISTIMIKTNRYIS